MGYTIVFWYEKLLSTIHFMLQLVYDPNPALMGLRDPQMSIKYHKYKILCSLNPLVMKQTEYAMFFSMENSF